MPLVRIRHLANVLVPDACVVKHPAKEVLRVVGLSSVEKVNIFRRGAIRFASSPSKTLASVTRRMSLGPPNAYAGTIGTITASPIRKARSGITSSDMLQAVRTSSRLQSTGMRSQSASQLRPMEPLIREGARAQVPPMQRVPFCPVRMTSVSKKLRIVQPLPREVVLAAAARMAGRQV
mmetsp:Transcript_23009/g.74506  ORF Transcript_23009/g.74506 Transcript_23009/m.74506 type:complete len:178 (-) Transcript_23009:217-750(-)